jgi:hypothetical protein
VEHEVVLHIAVHVQELHAPTETNLFFALAMNTLVNSLIVLDAATGTAPSAGLITVL